MMPNQSSALAAPRRKVVSAAVASSVSGNSMGKAKMSLMLGTRLKVMSMTRKLVSGN